MRVLFLLLLMLSPVAVLAQEAALPAVDALGVPPVPGGFGMQILMRWAHVLTAVVVVGGTVFMRMVLLPAAASVLDAPTHQALRSAILARWRKVVHAGIALFLLSGFFNYLFVTRHLHEDPQYHMFFGIKFLLALAVFVLAILLTSKKSYAAGIQAKAPLWMGILAVLSVIVVLMGGYMKALH